MDLSIVISLYNEQESLRELVDWIVRTLKDKGLEYEIILVDDGSRDGSWEVIKSMPSEFSGMYMRKKA